MAFLTSQLSNLTSDLQSYLPPQIQTFTQRYATRDNLQLLLRVVVGISTYILFRPRLEGLFRKMTGTPDARQAEIDARLEFLQQQKEGGGGTNPAPAQGGGRKQIGVAGSGGKVAKLVVPEAEGESKTEAGAKGGRRKKV